MMELPQKNLFTPQEVTTLFFGSQKSNKKVFLKNQAKVYRMLKKEQIPSKKIGDCWYVTLETLKQLLDKN